MQPIHSAAASLSTQRQHRRGHHSRARQPLASIPCHQQPCSPTPPCRRYPPADMPMSHRQRHPVPTAGPECAHGSAMRFSTSQHCCREHPVHESDQVSLWSRANLAVRRRLAKGAALAASPSAFAAEPELHVCGDVSSTAGLVTSIVATRIVALVLLEGLLLNRGARKRVEYGACACPHVRRQSQQLARQLVKTFNLQAANGST